MKHQQRLSLFLGVLFLLGACWLPALAAGAPQEKQEKEEFSAWLNNPTGSIKTGQVMISIERWSTPEEREKLIQAFKAGGQKAMFEVLTDLPEIGYIRLPRATGWPLHYAYQFPDDKGGRYIVIATDRKVGFQEARMDNMSMDYPFEMIQMQLDAQNRGEGKISLAARIIVSKDGSGFELENYGVEPVTMQNIHRPGDKDKEKEPQK